MDLTVPQRLYRLEKAAEDMGESLTRLEKQFDGLARVVESLLHDMKALAEERRAGHVPTRNSADPEPPPAGPAPGTMGTYNQSGGRQSLQ